MSRTENPSAPGAGPAEARPRRQRNPEAARHRILQAAEREFAARGLAGARVDRIARTARVNKRMLYHYFGGKRVLYRAVLERVWPAPGASWRPEGARLLLWALLEAPAGGEPAPALLGRDGRPALPLTGADTGADPVVAVVESWLAGQEAGALTASAKDASAVPPLRRKPRIRLKPRRD